MMNNFLSIRFVIIFFLITFYIVIFPFKMHAESSTPTQTDPLGEIIKLDFRMPGIGTESGNPNPINQVRNVTLYFFRPDVNTSDPNVRPLASLKTQATYDSDPNSPTFGNFANQNIDLGKEIPDGKYQISFKSDYALSKLVKDKESDVGGHVFDIINSYNQSINIRGKTVIIGDIYPSTTGDNIMDINDYNTLVSCFGTKADSTTCVDKQLADLDDNGAIDGTDYNLMFGSFKVLLSLGLPVPKLFNPNPKITPKPSISKAPKPATVKQKNQDNPKSPTKNSNPLPIIILTFVIVSGIAGGIIFFLRRKKQKVPVELPNDSETIPNDSQNIADGAVEEIVDKEFFVKKQAMDPEKNRTVLTLTDDSGPTLGYYSGEKVTEGFAKIKGRLKKEGDKVFIEVDEITPETSSAS